MTDGISTDPVPVSTAPPLEVDVMLEAMVWRGTVKGLETLCRRAAETAVAVGLGETALAGLADIHEPGLALCVVLEDDAAVAALNKAYRNVDRPTNVLSFAALEDAEGGVILPGSGDGLDDEDDGADAFDDDEPIHLGDVIIAFETTRDEALRDDRPLADHLAHLVVHGVLHLLGLDHQDDQQADSMEALETRVLAALGVPDPYADTAAERIAPRDQG